MPFFFTRLGVKWMLAVGMGAWVLRYVLFAAGAPDALARHRRRHVSHGQALHQCSQFRPKVSTLLGELVMVLRLPHPLVPRHHVKSAARYSVVSHVQTSRRSTPGQLPVTVGTAETPVTLLEHHHVRADAKNHSIH